MSWPLVKLSEVATINPRLPKDADETQEVSFIAMASASEEGFLLNEEPRVLDQTKKGFTYFDRSDVLLAKITPCFENGKCLRPNQISNKIGFGSTEFHVLRAHPEKIDSAYLFYIVWSDKFRCLGEAAMSGAAGQKRVSTDFLKNFEIPLPPLPEQKRIAAILDKADAIRRKRQQAIQLADEFLRSVFLDMFGDPVTNPKGWEVKHLGEMVGVVSGATPAKCNEFFWCGDFPWVSPKDMKSIEIAGSIDKVNEVVFEETNLKKLPVGSVLIVVRGMILAHTVPIGITTAEVSINQDIKALMPTGDVLPEFLLWFLKSQHEYLLSKVSTAAHGTKRFDMEDLLSIPVFVPSVQLQENFLRVVSTHNRNSESIKKSHNISKILFNSTGQKAFSGKL